MVRIPTYENQRALGTGSDQLKLINDEGAERDVGGGFRALATGLSTAAEVMQRRIDRDERFDAERQFLDYNNQATSIQRQAEENITPTGQGFHNNTMQEIQASAQRLLDAMPESQRQQMEIAIQRDLQTRSDALARVEVNQNRSFIRGVTQAHIARIQDNVTSGAWDMPTATAEIDRFLTGMAGTPEVTQQFRREFVRAAEVSRLEYLRTSNPAEFARQAQQYAANSPSPQAGPVQRLIIEQSRLHNADPQTALVIAQLESNNNPGITNPNSTAQGLFQMLRATRRRLAPMLGVTEEALERDPALQVAAQALLLNESRQRLEANGLPVTTTNLYMAHVLGQGGAMSFLNANRDADAYNLYVSIGGDPRAFGQNGGLLRRGMTVGQVQDAFNARVSDASRLVAPALQREPSAAPNAPVEIMGEQFTAVTAADLARPLAQATTALNQRSQQLIRAAVEQQNANPNIVANMYDAAWRRQQDDAARQSNPSSQLLAGNNDVIAQWTNFADRHGYLPQPVTAAVLQMMTSQNPELRRAAYEMAANIRRHNPIDGLRLSHFGGDTDAVGQNRAAMIRDYVNLTVHGNLSPDEAIRRVELTHSEAWQQRSRDADFEQNARQARQRRTWAEIEADNNLVTGRFSNLFGGNGFTNTDRGPQNPDVRQRYEERYQQFFDFHYRHSGGNEEQARVNALADLRLSLGASRLQGPTGNMMMPYPPERTNAPVVPLPVDSNNRPLDISVLTPAQLQASYGYITAQAQAEARRLLLEPRRQGEAQAQFDRRRAMADQVTANNVFLIPDGNTAQDVERRLPPRYRLFFQPPSGQPELLHPEFRADVARARERLLGGEPSGPLVTPAPGNTPDQTNTTVTPDNNTPSPPGTVRGVVRNGQIVPETVPPLNPPDPTRADRLRAKRPQ